jgi:hypothetical protein
MTMVPPATTKDSYFEIAGLRTGASAKHSSQRFVERHQHLHCLRPTGKLSSVPLGVGDEWDMLDT